MAKSKINFRRPKSIRVVGGKNYYLSVTAHTKTMAQSEAKRLRQETPCRVIKQQPNYYGVYCRKKAR